MLITGFTTFTVTQAILHSWDLFSHFQRSELFNLKNSFDAQKSSPEDWFQLCALIYILNSSSITSRYSSPLATSLQCVCVVLPSPLLTQPHRLLVCKQTLLFKRKLFVIVEKLYFFTSVVVMIGLTTTATSCLTATLAALFVTAIGQSVFRSGQCPAVPRVKDLDMKQVRRIE